MAISKICTKCQLQKPITEFHKRKPKGYHSACKACYNSYYRNRYAKYEATGSAALKYHEEPMADQEEEQDAPIDG